MNRLANRVLTALTLLCASVGARADVEEGQKAWPVLRSYAGEHLRRVKMPLGGIGTGTISLAGNGALVDWEIRSKPSKGFIPGAGRYPWFGLSPFFALRTETSDGDVKARILEGPVDSEYYEGHSGARACNHGFTRWRGCTFNVAYPLAQVALEDPALPVTATLEAMNPLLPGDADASGIPAALLRWKITNVSAAPLKASVFCLLANPASGAGSVARVEQDGLTGVRLGAEGSDLLRSGEITLALPQDSGAITTATESGNELDNAGLWQQFVDTGRAGNGGRRAYASVAVAFDLKPGETKTLPFALAWRFAHRYGWSKGADGKPVDLGNWYATRYPTALAAAQDLLTNLAEYEKGTVSFVRSVLAKKAPDVVKEAALFNLSTLRTETCFRTADGHFFSWEGCFDDEGVCSGTCTHVWGYEHALIDLWPSLAKDITELQFGPAMDERGCMRFRIALPIEANRDPKIPRWDAADGHLQCLVKAYENWRKTGDDAWMRKLYPNIRRAMEFVWIENGWDGDGDGVIEGCQHNTMDVEYVGPNPQMEFLYLAALKATAAMADGADDAAFAAKCRALAEKGSAWTEANLFNGDYYEQKVVPMTVTPAEGTYPRNVKDLAHPDRQLGDGCLVDQLLGDYAARAVGLGPVADERHAQKTLETILERNASANFEIGFNHMRGFALPDEPSLKMAWYPKNRREKHPFPYYTETMTGFEYVVAAALAQRGDFARAERVVRDIRSRYDGKKRNPFDEAECGHHYVRALAAWTVLKAFEDVQKRQVREVELTDDWLNVDCRINGWDEKTGFRVYVDGREEYAAWELISGGAKHNYAFDVRRFRGKKAQIVATALGGWEDVGLNEVWVSDRPAVDAVVRTVPIEDCLPVNVACTRKDGQKYLCVPVRRDAMPVHCTVCDGDGEDGDCPMFDLRIRLATDGRGEFQATIPLDGFGGSHVRLKSAFPVVPKASAADFEKSVCLADGPRPGAPWITHPKLHFQAPFGGSGDMVGFFRLGDVFHMGYLHDYGYDGWIENCCWSHATSTDFFNWQAAPAYDRKGVGERRTSGSCLVDVRNASGLGDGTTPPVLLFGCFEVDGSQRWQPDRLNRPGEPERRPGLLPRLGLKVSRDGGRTFASIAKPLFTMQAIGGHDPEVVYDAAHGIYVMVTHDRRDGAWGFDFYVSKNLLDWEYASTVSGLWETPNFYPLVCEGKTWWVLQQCRLEYLVGEFDGRVFTPQGKLNASFKGAFAPRTVETADGRRVLMAARLHAGPTGGATLPMELKLVPTSRGPRLAYQPVREIAKYADRVSDTTTEIDGDVWEVAGMKGRFLEGEPRVVRKIVDGPVTDYFVGWGVVAGTLPTSATGAER